MAAHEQERIEVLQLGHTTLDDIFAHFNHFHNRIGIFHYGGHSGEDFLSLADTNARSVGLSLLMGMQKQLRLVFLNGCANHQMVSHLLEIGVKAIIATSAPVDDQSAYELSNTFYHALANGKNIIESFDTAKAKVLNSRQNLNIDSFRSINLPGETTEEFPWGLYYTLV